MGIFWVYFYAYYTFFNREKMMKTANLKEHPYSSHISRFAVFPSFLSPDDLERGVRAASQSFINPLIPNKAPDVTVVSKTIGEILFFKDSGED